jgi:hypothetical protein
VKCVQDILEFIRNIAVFIEQNSNRKLLSSLLMFSNLNLLWKI